MVRRRDFLIGCAAGGASANGRLDALLASWEKQVPELMRETKVPGVSMAVIAGAKLRWRRGFGITDRASPRPVDPHTIFEAASMSKPVFAYAVMKLAEKGLLDLDTPLTRYTPERFLEGDARLDSITARHVLSHSTGFPNWRSSHEPFRIAFTPGEKYGYSGEGYYYLQTVVTHLTGRVNRSLCRGGYEGDLEVCATDMGDYLKRHVLSPFGMHSSSYDPPAAAKRMARGHDRGGAPLPPAHRKPTDAARYAAAGALLTTPSDYARFLIEVIHPKPRDPFRLARRSLDEMLKPQTLVQQTDEYRISWALGWRTVSTKDTELIGHGGDNAGFHCLAEASPARRSGFVIMTNGDGGVDFLQKFAPAVSSAVHAVPG